MGLTHLQAFTGTLTHLSLQDLRHSESEFACQQLEGLTSLHCLVLKAASNKLLPGISALTNLTSLFLQDVQPGTGMASLQLAGCKTSHHSCWSSPCPLRIMRPLSSTLWI